MRKIVPFLLLIVCLPLYAQPISIDSLRLWAAPDRTRLVFDTSGPVEHNLFALKGPDRLVIDIKNSRLKGSLPHPKSDNLLLRNLRSAQRNKSDLRVVLDLKGQVKPRSFILKPNRQYGYRLVVDLYGLGKKPTRVKSIKTIGKSNLRDIVIAIDAGHGGDDPGAKGRQGTYEKNVVMAIARRLGVLVNNEKGMRPVLIRQGDYYMGLRERMKKAREHRADLFISIHADAFRDSRVRGASVYTLSSRGASSEAARWLAERENSADLVGGVELKDKDDVLASVLLDLSQTGTLQASHDVAAKVLGQLKGLTKTHKRTVQKAGFAVLKAPDIPSILVETAFISNPIEERRLKDPVHQQRLAASMMTGIRGYFRRNAPPGTLLATVASRRHVISRGDTLGDIARQYHVGLNHLRMANELSNDQIRIGQVLQIPES